MELNGKDIFAQKRLDFMFRLACGILGRSDEAQDMMQDVASPDVKSLLDRISSIRIISCDRQDDHIVGIARRNVGGDDYEVISQIKEDGSSSYFYIKEKGRKSKDVSFVMIVSGPKGSAVMEIVGEFDVKDISKLSVIGQKK